MALLGHLTTKLDLFVFGPNEMNGNEGVEFMPDAYKYTIVGDILDSTNPKIKSNGWKVLLSRTFTFVEYPALPL